MLNAAAAKMSYSCNFIKNTGQVSKRIPISSRLTESVLIDAIDEVNQYARFIWDTLTLDLLQKSDTHALPLPSPGKEESMALPEKAELTMQSEPTSGKGEPPH